MCKSQELTVYKLPFSARSSLSWLYRIVFIMGILSASSFVYLLLYIDLVKRSDEPQILISLFFILIDACFIYVLFFYDILRKGVIEITEEYLKFRDMYRLRKYKWAEIYSADIYYFRGNAMLGIVLKKSLNRRKSLWKKMNSALGDPYDIRLAISVYPGINTTALLLTIQYQLSQAGNL